MRMFVTVLVVLGLITFSSCSKKDKAEEPVKEAPKEEMVKFTVDTNGTSSSPSVTMESKKATMMYYKHPSETSSSWLIYLGMDGNHFISISLPTLEKKAHKFDEVFPSTTSATVNLNNVFYTTVRSGKPNGTVPGTITIESVSDSIISGAYDFIATKYNSKGDTAVASYKIKGEFVVKRENWDVIAK